MDLRNTRFLHLDAARFRAASRSVPVMAARLVAAFALAAIFFAAQGGAQNAAPEFTELYNFQPLADGTNPYGNLIRDPHGMLYGATSSGGAGGYGTVYSLTPPASPGAAWTETLLYSFEGGRNGFGPQAGVVMGKDGALYGTTSEGGEKSCLCGTVFRLAPPAAPGGAWRHTVLHRFAGGQDGTTPTGSLAVGSNGELYGTTLRGGTDGSGVVFGVTPPAAACGGWTESILHTFTGSHGDGIGPNHGLAIANNGTLYGTTLFGGTSKSACNGGCGIVFQFTPPRSPDGAWTETVLHNFTGAGDGGYPGVFVTGSNGALYGTTAMGGVSGAGAVYELTPPATAGGAWSETVLYNFTAGKLVPNVVSSLAIAGSRELYATTYLGGKYRGGTIVKLTSPATTGDPWQQHILHRFARPLDTRYRNQPGGLFLGSDGVLFGITSYGGSGQCMAQGVTTGCGTVFELKP